MISFFYDLIRVLPCGLAGMLLLRPHIGLPEGNVLFYIIALTFLFYVVGFWHIKYWGKGILSGVLLFTVITAVLIQEPEVRGEYVTEHLYILWMLLLSVASLLCMKLSEQSKWVSRFMLPALMAGGVLIMYFNLPVEKIAASMLFLLFLLLIVQEVQRTWKKSGYTDAKKHLVFLTPFLLLCILVVFLIPAPRHAYDWGIARALWEKATKGIHLTSEFFKDSSEDFSVMGFADENDFAGALKAEKKDIMTIKASKDAGDVLYLSGKYFDTFDGRNWTMSESVETSDCTMDTLETLCAVRSYDSYRFRDFLCHAEVVVEYGKFHTGIVFLPQKSIIGRDSLGRIKYKEYNEGILSDRQLGYGTKYHVDFYRINSTHMDFAELTEVNRAFTRSEWDASRKYFQTDFKERYSYDEYLTYRERIKENYTSEVILSPETDALLDKICEGADTELEKLLRIESYLRKMHYNVAPGLLPETVQNEGDFLDYFLLEKKEGYCISFATAFTLLARAEGYPARYVQGYRMPVKEQEEVTVTSAMAHAWPEVYLDNIGWVGFEPTPGFSRAGGWATIAETEAEVATLEEERESTESVSELTEEELWEDMEFEEEGFPYLLVLIPVLLTALLITDFLIVEKHMLKKWYARMNVKNKIRVLSRRNMELLRLLKYGIKDGETLEEYRLRLLAKWKEADLDFLSCYEDISYGKAEPEEEALHKTEASIENLGQFLKKEYKWKYTFLHWFVNRLWI